MSGYRSSGLVVRLVLIGLAFALSIDSSVAQDSKLLPIRIAATPDAVSVPQWIAMQERIFQKYGLDPHETVYNVNYQGLLAIGAQQGDVSIQADPPTIAALAKGMDAVIVAVVARFTSGYKLVASKSIRSMSDLTGKKVAWPTGTGAEYALIQIAKARKFDVSNFIHVDLPPAEGIPLLLKGNLSAAMYWEPWPRTAVRQGRGSLHVIATSKGIYESNMFVTVRRAFAEQHPEAVENLLRALRDAQEVFKKDPNLGIAIYQKRMRVSKEVAKDSMGDYALMLRLDKQAASTAESVAEWEKSNKKIKSLPDWKTAFDARYLRAIDPSAVQNFPW